MGMKKETSGQGRVALKYGDGSFTYPYVLRDVEPEENLYLALETPVR
jgi:hypothetical protein